MDYEEYKREVVKRARTELGKRGSDGVCLDTIKGSYLSGATVKDAAVLAACNTDWWNYGGFPPTNEEE